MAKSKKTILAIGQDLFSIDAYLKSQYNYSLHRYMDEQEQEGATTSHTDSIDDSSRTTARRNKSIPRARSAEIPTLRDVTPPVFMAYTDLQTLVGLDRPTDYGSGVEYADGIRQILPTSREAGVGLQLGLWLNGTDGCRDAVQGRLDAQIRRLVAYLSSSTSFDRVWLRIGYEFDNPSFGYLQEPQWYREAFRTIVTACRSDANCFRRTRFVWHSWAASFTESNELVPFYPGDDVVDWIGISIFSQLYATEASSSADVVRLGDEDTIQAVLEFAQRRRKPTMIAESTPFGGIPVRNDPWEAWFRPVLNLIGEHGIGMWCYINCDWESQPMWHQVGFGDTRLDSNDTVLRLWQEEVLQNPQFQSHGNAEFDERLSSKPAMPLFALLSRSSTPQPPYRRDGPLLSSVQCFFAAALAFVIVVFTARKAMTNPPANDSRTSPDATCCTEGDAREAKNVRRSTVYGAIH